MECSKGSVLKIHSKSLIKEGMINEIKRYLFAILLR